MTRPILITTPGFYPSITCEQYFLEPCPTPAFTNSGAKILLSQTPADFADNHPAIGEPAEEIDNTIAKRRGDLTHQLALGKGRGIQVCEFDSWRTNDAKAAKAAAITSGLTPCLPHEYGEALAMAILLQSRIRATLTHIGDERGLTEPKDGWQYETELVLAWTEIIDGQTIWCRGMLDVWCEQLGVILDPKITDRIYDGQIDAHRANMGWDMQEAFYKRGIETILPELAGRVRFGNLLMRPKAPHRARTVDSDEATRYSCQTEIERAMGIFAKCMKDNEWPDFGLGFHTRSAPSWKLRERMEREMMEDEDDG